MNHFRQRVLPAGKASFLDGEMSGFAEQLPSSALLSKNRVEGDVFNGPDSRLPVGLKKSREFILFIVLMKSWSPPAPRSLGLPASCPRSSKCGTPESCGTRFSSSKEKSSHSRPILLTDCCWYHHLPGPASPVNTQH